MRKNWNTAALIIVGLLLGMLLHLAFVQVNSPNFLENESTTSEIVEVEILTQVIEKEED